MICRDLPQWISAVSYPGTAMDNQYVQWSFTQQVESWSILNEYIDSLWTFQNCLNNTISLNWIAMVEWLYFIILFPTKWKTS